MTTFLIFVTVALVLVLGWKLIWYVAKSSASGEVGLPPLIKEHTADDKSAPPPA